MSSVRWAILVIKHNLRHFAWTSWNPNLTYVPKFENIEIKYTILSTQNTYRMPMRDLRICHAAFSLSHVCGSCSYPLQAYETNAETINNAVYTSTMSKIEKISEVFLLVRMNFQPVPIDPSFGSPVKNTPAGDSQQLYHGPIYQSWCTLHVFPVKLCPRKPKAAI